MNSGINVPVILKAQNTARQILKEAGIKIEWRNSMSKCACAESSIAIELSTQTPEAWHPGAFAFAQPYKNTRVVLFYDRVVNTPQPELRCGLLGHVLAHEITHVLQGVVRHSTRGLMKPKWNYLDYGEMLGTHLQFTDEDIELIQNRKTSIRSTN